MHNEFLGEEYTPEGPAFIDARLLDQLDSIKQLCAEFTNKPLEHNAKKLGDAITSHISSLRIALEQMDDSGGEQTINEMISYVKGLEIYRVSFLNEFHLNNDEPYVVAVDAYDDLYEILLDDECDEVDDPIDTILDLYQVSFQVDVNRLSSISTAEYSERPDVKRKEVLKKIGAHALDVAKVGLGVFIGITAAKKSRIL